VFLSSGNDARDLRDRVEKIFRAASEILGIRNSPIRIDINRWEHHASQRVPRGRVNDQFVAEAKKATMTVALLLQDLRPGTLAELQAVLTQTDRSVAVLWFRQPGEPASDALRRFLDRWQNQLLYNEVGDPDDETAWLGLVRVLVDFLVKIVHDELDASQEIFYETR
jgi:hypothetical protein